MVVKKNEVYLVELEFGKGSLMCVGVENIFVYGDFGVRVYFDYVFLVELGYYYFCGCVVFIVFLIVWDYIVCKRGGVVIIKYFFFLCKC